MFIPHCNITFTSDARHYPSEDSLCLTPKYYTTVEATDSGTVRINCGCKKFYGISPNSCRQKIVIFLMLARLEQNDKHFLGRIYISEGSLPETPESETVSKY